MVEGTRAPVARLSKAVQSEGWIVDYQASMEKRGLVACSFFLMIIFSCRTTGLIKRMEQSGGKSTRRYRASPCILCFST